MTKRIIFAAAVGALGLTPTIASAQATRTWVSGVGDDANPCSRTAPCKTFAGTIAKTADGGEINCLDSGSFGTVTITKSITIDCTGHFSGQTASTTNGITINDSAGSAPGTSRVILRGLSITGAPIALPGNLGIRFLSGASLILTNSTIQSFNGASPNGFGIIFAPQGPATLTVVNTVIANNGIGGTGGGMLIQPTGASGSARVEMDNVTLLNNTNAAIRVDTTGGTSPAGVQLLVTNSHLYNSGNGVTAVSAGGSPAQVNIFDSRIFNNQPGSALVANGNFAFIRAGNNVIIGNGAAVQVLNGGTVRSVGNNVVDGNSNASSFSPPNIIPQ